MKTCNGDGIIEHSASSDAFAKTSFHALFTLSENKFEIFFGFKNKKSRVSSAGKFK